MRPAFSRPLSPPAQAALRGGVVGNYIDNLHVFLPVVALAPAMGAIAGADSAAAMGGFVIIALLLGRPLGGAVFGLVSDRFGRTRTTRLALAGTALTAVLVALLPTHAAIGAAALWAILVLRFAGGVCIAGEYSAAIPLAMEWARPARRGTASGLILSMAPLAQASIAFATAILLEVLGAEAYAGYGWRALFLAAAVASIGMIAYYSVHVVDSPAFHRSRAASAAPPARMRELLAGRYRGPFWQAFALMTGLWLLTDATVLILPSSLRTAGHISEESVAVVMGCASIAQAVFMVLAGYLSTRVGRRRLLLGWGAAAAVLGPASWLACVGSAALGWALLWAMVAQVVTVSAYGPMSAYLSERFPTRVRSTGYGMAYSWSLVVPALYPFYLPTLQGWFGSTAAVAGMVALGGAIVVVAAGLGPRLAAEDVARPLEDLAAQGG